MRSLATWIFGFLASMIAGSAIGVSLADIGSTWGILVGAYAFALLRLWS
jgi:hypothetical protein